MNYTYSKLEDAIGQIPVKAKIFIHGAAATPNILLQEVVNQYDRFEQLEFMHLHTIGPATYADPKYHSRFKVTNLFIGENLRSRMNFNEVDYIPCFLSEISSLIRKSARKPDVALVQVSPPDRHGFCTLGTSVDVARAAVEVASLVIAQVNENMPRLHGDALVHVRDLDHMVLINSPLPEVKLPILHDTEEQIGKYVASLIEDGATLQLGIGAIPNAVLRFLHNHKDLGLHTELWSDGALELMEKGIINNRRKKIHPHKSVSTLLFGTKKLYDFINDNPAVIQLEASYVNNPAVISRNKRATAINSAVEIDLTGQVCSDSIGHHIISGVGGQIDFMQGASMSEGGKPIIALTSRTHKGVSRLVSSLKHGAGVVTTRAHIHHVVTEYGIADLFGKTINERAQALILIAHPDDRERLAREWSTILHRK